MRQGYRIGTASVARVVIGTLVASALAVGVVQQSPAQPAFAYTANEFDPGYIISDAQFYAGTSMTESQIQDFLNAMRPTCRTGSVCLKDYTTPTQSKAANPMCSGYAGAASEKAARILAKVASACGISPKVLLVMLQKEQGLITANPPTERNYRAAMGAGCPDTADCDPAQAGFFQQVYFAAWYLKRYAGPPGTGPGTEYTSTFNAYAKFSNYAPGANFQIRYHPNAACGTKTVFIRNQPTASLYTYTPYTPNAAALANLGGTGDACSAYGNRNFWDFYYAWFGDPTPEDTPPVKPIGVETSRIEGVDRFATAVELSKARGTQTADVVYIANGNDFPDALSGAAAAAKLRAPLLLVPTAKIPDVVKAELTRLDPRLIVVVGGEEAVSAAVFDELADYAREPVRRDGGANRFETSRTIAAGAFTAARTVYIATGLGFADALSASSAAGSRGAPVILVDGKATVIDSETARIFAELGVNRVIVAGGAVAVNDDLVASIEAIPFITVTRIGGKDRYEVSSAVNRDVFGTSPTVYVASGVNFPDALAGAALAGSQSSALYLARPTCIYRQTAQDLIDLRTTKMVILGGRTAVADGVASFVNCD